MYHESIHAWSPGKLGALREIALAREEGRRWYMMGYYIHGCAKMRYKAAYAPQWVLDPESYTWDLLDKEFRARLDGRKYVSLSAERKDGSKSGGDINRVAESTASDEETLDDASPEQGQRFVVGLPLSNPVLISSSNSPSNDPDAEGGPSSLLASMPGVMTRAEIAEQVDLDSIRLLIRGYPVLTSDLVAWEDGDVDKQGSVKCMFADFVTVLGADLAGRCVVALG
jgi:arginine-tRNA-protein transferase